MNKLCQHSKCELIKSQNKIEKFIEELMNSSLKMLQYKYPKHNKDCLQRIFAERIKVEHHSLLGELIHKQLVTRKEVTND
jgi:hypothetical protein